VGVNLKICLANAYLDVVAGGAQRYTVELASALLKEGHDVTMLVGQSKVKAEGYKVAFFREHRMDWLPLTPFQIANTFERTKQLHSIKKNFDVVHDTDLGYLPSADVATAQQPAGALRESVKAGKPFWASSFLEALFILYVRQPFLYPLLTRKALQSYKKIIVPSKLVESTFKKEFGLNEDVMVRIPHGVNVETFKPNMVTREAIRSELGLTSDEMLLCFPGGLDPTRKGLFTVLKALSLSKKTKLIVLGKNKLPWTYIEMLNRLSLRDKVVCLRTKDVVKYYSASDIMVFPTLWDAFGLVILEGMACELPVITSSRAGASELIDNWRDGIVIRDPLNYTEIAECIESLRDENLRKQIGKRAREKARMYDWSVVVKQVVKVYEGLLDVRTAKL
jgi:glycosyltransferase involved in cell wall biosynthesis